VTWYLKPWCLPGEIMTDMYYPIYAEGLYDALMQVRVCWARCKLSGHCAPPQQQRPTHDAVAPPCGMQQLRNCCFDCCCCSSMLLHWLLSHHALQASEYNMPIYITETGIADKQDGNRSHMIDEYMRAVRRGFSLSDKGLGLSDKGLGLRLKG
jgi:hypothetical protein